MGARHQEWLALLPLLLGLLEIYRRRRLKRAPRARPRRDEVPAERAYEPIQPESGTREHVERTSDFLLAAHRGWSKIVLVLVVLYLVVAVVKDPFVRTVLGITVTVMAVISVVWWLRTRRASEREAVLRDRGEGEHP